MIMIIPPRHTRAQFSLSLPSLYVGMFVGVVLTIATYEVAAVHEVPAPFVLLALTIVIVILAEIIRVIERWRMPPS